MKYVFLMVAILTTLPAHSQQEDSWTITLNKTILAKGIAGDEDAVVTLQPSTISKGAGKVFTIAYRQPKPNRGWNRTFELSNEEDETLHTAKLQTAAGSVTVPLSILARQATSKAPVFVYTMSLPNDQKKAAVVRVRRILLCKIVWN